MSVSGADADSEVFAYLKHPIRRRIVCLLSDKMMSFSELQKELGIGSSHLSYHIACLGNLVHRTDDGKYALSRLGKAAFSAMMGVGEIHAAPKSIPNAPQRKQWRRFRLGNHLLPLWPFATVLMVSLIVSGAVAYYLFPSFTVPLQVKEPIEIVSYPSQWSLYPGETAQFNVTIMNQASLNYSVVLDFTSSNMTYQTDYLSFSDENYTVVPGQQTLAAWISVSADAPAANLNVTVTVSRVAAEGSIKCVLGPTLGTWGSGESFNVTLSNTPSSGDVLICTFGDNNVSGFDTIVNIAEANGNVTWTRQVGNTYYDYNIYDAMYIYMDSEIWVGTVNSATASRTITITLVSGVTYGAEAFVSEYSGVATSGFLDRTASNQGFSTESDSGTTATTTQANELCIASIVATAPQNSPTNGFTLTHYTAGADCDLGNFNKTLSTTGMIDTGANMGVYLHEYDGCIATFFASRQV